MSVKAVNTYVFVKRDKANKEENGLILPQSGKVKPHQGEIISVGGAVADPDIKKGVGKKAIFHKGIGQDMEVDGVDFLVLEAGQIIGVK